jgi:hypothetical protein
MKRLGSLIKIKFNYFFRKFYVNFFIQKVAEKLKIIIKKKELIF